MSDDFTRHIIQVVIARVAEAHGFGSISEAAFEILVDSVIDTLSAYARGAGAIAAASGRTHANALDVFCGLSRHGVTIDGLCEFLRSSPQIPQFEFLVEPYPLPRATRFTQAQNASTSCPTSVPFRANSTFFAQDGDRFVPAFFPHYPTPYTYDHKTLPVDSVADDSETQKKRESDQQQIKEALTKLLAGGNSDAPHEMNFDGELASLEGSHLISAPTDLLEAPTYPLDGVRCTFDPEFLPMIPVTDELAGEAANRATGEMLMILSIKQGSTEPGTLKTATYTSCGPEKELERAPSPASP